MVTDLLDITILSDDLSLLALQCLTNISVTPTCHNAFTRTVQSLYNLLDSQLERRVGILRVLINLSANQDFVVYLLSAKVTQHSEDKQPEHFVHFPGMIFVVLTEASVQHQAV